MRNHLTTCLYCGHAFLGNSCRDRTVCNDPECLRLEVLVVDTVRAEMLERMDAGREGYRALVASLGVPARLLGDSQ